MKHQGHAALKTITGWGGGHYGLTVWAEVMSRYRIWWITDSTTVISLTVCSDKADVLLYPTPAPCRLPECRSQQWRSAPSSQLHCDGEVVIVTAMLLQLQMFHNRVWSSKSEAMLDFHSALGTWRMSEGVHGSQPGEGGPPFLNTFTENFVPCKSSKIDQRKTVINVTGHFKMSINGFCGSNMVITPLLLLFLWCQNDESTKKMLGGVFWWPDVNTDVFFVSYSSSFVLICQKTKFPFFRNWKRSRARTTQQIRSIKGETSPDASFQLLFLQLEHNSSNFT